MADAIRRRSEQELGFNTELSFIYKFQYQAHFEDAGAEHELCSVFVGRYAGEVSVNASEIQAFRWVSRDALEREMASSPDHFTPWFKMEWQVLTQDYPAAIT